MMEITETFLPGVLIIRPKIFQDSRGFFFESFNDQRYRQHGITKPFVQDNISRSRKNVVRGLHYQLGRPQAKLVSVLRGAVFDVVADIRKGSPTFGRWFAQELSDENRLQIYVPEGYAHGFYALTDDVDFMYKCADYYYPQGERGIRWDDPTLAIAWPGKEGILSEKDLIHPYLLDATELPAYEG